MEESKVRPAGLCEVCGEGRRGSTSAPNARSSAAPWNAAGSTKVDRDCSGKREQSSYQGLKQLGDSDLRRDYHFLENVLSRKDSAKRTLSQSLGGLREDGSQRRQGGAVGVPGGTATKKHAQL